MKRYKSEASRAIHEVAEAMNAAGIIPDERMREFDSRHLAGSVLPAPRIPAQETASPLLENYCPMGYVKNIGDSGPF